MQTVLFQQNFEIKQKTALIFLRGQNEFEGWKFFWTCTATRIT